MRVLEEELALYKRDVAECKAVLRHIEEEGAPKVSQPGIHAFMCA